MSIDEDIPGNEVFLDKSVLLNRIQIEIEGNRGSRELFEDQELRKTVSEKVANAVETRIDNRSQAYRDMAIFLKNTDEDGRPSDDIVYEYEVLDSNRPPRREDLSQDDVEHIWEVQHHIASVDKPGYTLRKYQRAYKKRLASILDSALEFDYDGDRQLAHRIGDTIGDHEDGEVLAQAVKWKHIRVNNQNRTVETLVSKDDDMYSNENDINSTIKDTAGYSIGSTLTILALHEFKEGGLE